MKMVKYFRILHRGVNKRLHVIFVLAAKRLALHLQHHRQYEQKEHIPDEHKAIVDIY